VAGGKRGRGKRDEGAWGKRRAEETENMGENGDTASTQCSPIRVGKGHDVRTVAATTPMPLHLLHLP
jgi:hypothetical protein